MTRGQGVIVHWWLCPRSPALPGARPLPTPRPDPGKEAGGGLGAGLQEPPLSPLLSSRQPQSLFRNLRAPYPHPGTRLPQTESQGEPTHHFTGVRSGQLPHLEVTLGPQTLSLLTGLQININIKWEKNLLNHLTRISTHQKSSGKRRSVWEADFFPVSLMDTRT